MCRANYTGVKLVSKLISRKAGVRKKEYREMSRRLAESLAVGASGGGAMLPYGYYFPVDGSRYFFGAQSVYEGWKVRMVV